MGEQLIISISREYGSGGHEIARKLADRLELAFYDRCMLDEIAEQMNADVSDFHKYDEKPGNRLLSRHHNYLAYTAVVERLYGVCRFSSQRV